MSEIRGDSSSEILTGTDEADKITTNDGNDTVYARGGNDEINGSFTSIPQTPGAATSWTFYDASGQLTLYGGSGDDQVIGGKNTDKIYGEAGNDLLAGLAGDDYIDGGDGDDYLSGGDGNDTLNGGIGDDDLRGGDGDDTLNGGIGDDDLRGADGNDILNGGDGDDELRGGDGNDILTGGIGNDTILSGDGNDMVYAGGGNDEINGSFTSIPQTPGAATSWTFYDASGQLTLYGGSGDDQVIGGKNTDKIYGEAGNDLLAGLAGDDYIDGGDGDDYLSGGDGNDTLNGGIGDDDLRGLNGNDILNGGDGDDYLFGGDGNDTLNGGTGYDVLQGGEGNDTYIINSTTFDLYDTGGNDTAIVNADFVRVSDEIENIKYAGGVLPLPYWIASLIDDDAAKYKNLLGTDQIFTYSFPSSLPTYYDNNEFNKNFQTITQKSQLNIEDFFSLLPSFLNLTFIENPVNANLNNISIWTTDLPDKVAGKGTYPNNSYSGSDIRIDNKNSSIEEGVYGSSTFIHELGHALGLKHPFSSPSAGPDGEVDPGPYLDQQEGNGTWTQMSYDSSPAENVFAFRPLDIAALHYLYGPSKTARSGDDTYVFQEDVPNFIWDGAGIDTIDASSSSKPVTIFLTPGYHGHSGLTKEYKLITSPGQITVNFGSDIENLIGSSYSDNLYGNGLNNIITPGFGSDSIDGKAGIDTAAYNASRSEFSISTFIDYGLGPGISLKTAWNVSSLNTDTLRNVERIRFTDMSLALDLEGNAGKVVKLLGALLGKELATNKTYIGMGLDILDNGMSYEEFMKAGLDAVFGSNPNGAAVVDVLYKNLVGSSAPQSLLDEYGGMLDNGSMTSTELGIAVADHGLNATNVDLVGLAQTGVEYVLYG